MLASVAVSVSSAALVSAVILAPVSVPTVTAVIPVAAAMVSAITAVPIAPAVVLPGRPPRVDAWRPSLVPRLEVGVLLVPLGVPIGKLPLALGQERLLLRR